MGKLNKSSKYLIAFIIFLVLAFSTYFIISSSIGSKTETMEGSDTTPFGAVDLPLENELTGLGLDNSVITDHIDKDYKLHDYKLDLQNKAIIYSYYTKQASYGDRIKMTTYSMAQSDFENRIIPKSNVLDSGFNGMAAKYYSGTYYYVNDSYKPSENVQQSINDGKIILEKGNETSNCDIGTIQCLYWYNNGVGYCFEAINMPELGQNEILEMASKYWDNATNSEDE